MILNLLYLISMLLAYITGEMCHLNQLPLLPAEPFAEQLLMPSGLDHIRIRREFYIPYLAFYFGNIQYDKIDICMYPARLLLSTSKQLCAYTHCTFSTRNKQDHPEETASVSVRKNNSVSKIS